MVGMRRGRNNPATICKQIVKLGHQLQMALRDEGGIGGRGAGRAATATTRSNIRRGKSTTRRTKIKATRGPGRGRRAAGTVM
jgi:hypothetical protein